MGSPSQVRLLAALLTACYECDLVPAGFLDGTITPLLKHGAQDATLPAANRSINILGCDYRGGVLGYSGADRFVAGPVRRRCHGMEPSMRSQVCWEMLEIRVGLAHCC